MGYGGSGQSRSGLADTRRGAGRLALFFLISDVWALEQGHDRAQRIIDDSSLLSSTLLYRFHGDAFQPLALNLTRSRCFTTLCAAPPITRHRRAIGVGAVGSLFITLVVATVRVFVSCGLWTAWVPDYVRLIAVYRGAVLAIQEGRLGLLDRG